MTTIKKLHHQTPPSIAEALASTLSQPHLYATNTSLAWHAVQLHVHMEKENSCITIFQKWLVTEGGLDGIYYTQSRDVYPK